MRSCVGVVKESIRRKRGEARSAADESRFVTLRTQNYRDNYSGTMKRNAKGAKV